MISAVGSGASGGQSEREIPNVSGGSGSLSETRPVYAAPALGSRSDCPPNAKPVPGGCIPRGAAYVVYGERCKSARLAVEHYRSLTWERQRARQGELADRTPIVRGKSCRWARFTAAEWQARARSARRSLVRFLTDRTLRDFAFSDGNHAWHKAVREVQKVFPGTEGWLLSCSAAEGGHGRWVGYSGVSYSTWLRDSDTVGGPLQYRFSTFTGMYRRAVEYVTGKGYRVPRMDSTSAWRSALGQALAGGWARYTGNDNSHWSASWGRGC